MPAVNDEYSYLSDLLGAEGSISDLRRAYWFAMRNGTLSGGGGGVSAPSDLVFEESFAGYPNGVLAQSGKWLVVTGSELPEVTSGTLTSPGTGYAWYTAPGANYWEHELSWAGAGTPQTNTIAVGTTLGSLLDLVHLNVSIIGWDLQFRVNGNWVTAAPSAFGDWRTPMRADGTHYRVGLAVTENGALVFGPHGERYAVEAPQARKSTGDYAFVEPVGRGTGIYSQLRTVRAYKKSIPQLDGSGWLIGPGGDTIVAGKNTLNEVSIGVDPATGGSALVIGPKQLVTTLYSAATAGATSVVTWDPILDGQTYVIDPDGPNQETVTSSSWSGVSRPYSTTVSALTKSHAAGETIICTNVASDRRLVLGFNPVAPVFKLPSHLVEGQVYFNGQTALIESWASGVISTYGVGAGKGAFAAGTWPTSGRPAASAVQKGGQGYDTTLNIPIWSDGTVWKNAAGTTV